MVKAVIDKRTINHQQWRAIKAIRSKKVTPQEFKAKWDVTNLDLSRLLGVGLSTIDRATMQGETQRDLHPRYHERLSEIDFILESMDKMQESMDRVPENIKRLYEEIKSR